MDPLRRRNERDLYGVLCTRCRHYQVAGSRCGLYDCEIVTKLTLRVDCPDYKQKPLKISRKRQEYMKKYRAEHRDEINEWNREYMQKNRAKLKAESEGIKNGKN